MFLTLDEALATSQSTIKGADSSRKLIWRQWLATMCLPELGISEDDIKIATLYPVDFAAAKPADMRALVELSLFDTNGCQLKHIFRAGAKRIYRDNRIPSTAVVDTALQQIGAIVPVDVSEDPYSFFLGTNADKVNAIVVRYYAYQTDEQGLPMIRQEEVMAVVFFLQFMEALRDNDNQSEINLKRQMWMQESDRIKAKKKTVSLSNDKMRHIQNAWMNIIPQFSKHNF